MVAVPPMSPCSQSCSALVTWHVAEPECVPVRQNELLQRVIRAGSQGEVGKGHQQHSWLPSKVKLWGMFLSL